MPPVGFKPTISAGERPQTYALNRAATGTGKLYYTANENTGQFFYSVIEYDSFIGQTDSQHPSGHPVTAAVPPNSDNRNTL
jgi:hypothetical protein